MTTIDLISFNADQEFCSDSNASSSSEDEEICAPEVINLQQSAVRDEVEPSPPSKQSTPATTVKSDGVNILGGLASAYASSDDDDDDEKVVDDDSGGKGDLDGSAAVTDKDDVVEDSKNNNDSINNNNGASSDGTSSLSKKKRRKRKKKNAGEEEKPEFVDRLLTDGQVKYQLTKKRQRRNPTLLERLLAPEIRKERNVILQYFDYIFTCIFAVEMLLKVQKIIFKLENL